jgi:hypothetical protein
LWGSVGRVWLGVGGGRLGEGGEDWMGGRVGY